MQAGISHRAGNVWQQRTHNMFGQSLQLLPRAKDWPEACRFEFSLLSMHTHFWQAGVLAASPRQNNRICLIALTRLRHVVLLLPVC